MKVKNDLSYHNLSVEDATELAALEVIGSKRSYALNWCKPNYDDDDDDDDDDNAECYKPVLSAPRGIITSAYFLVYKQHKNSKQQRLVS